MKKRKSSLVLSTNQANFVENMAKDLPLKLATIAAGYSEKNAAVLGLQLMKKPHIVEAIQERKLLAAQFHEVTPEQVIGATVMRAFCSLDDAFDEKGNFSISKARKTGAIHLIKSYEKKSNGAIKVQFYDNAEAQNKLGNYLGMDMAPKENNDYFSLKEGINRVAREIANGENSKEITKEHRQQAFESVIEWAKKSKARYTPEAIQEVSKEFSN